MNQVFNILSTWDNSSTNVYSFTPFLPLSSYADKYKRLKLIMLQVKSWYFDRPNEKCVLLKDKVSKKQQTKNRTVDF